MAAARNEQRTPTSNEVRLSINRMKTRFRRFLESEEGSGVVYRFKVRRIPGWGRQQLASIAACESHGNPSTMSGGGTYRGMYPFSFRTGRSSAEAATRPRHHATSRPGAPGCC